MPDRKKLQIGYNALRDLRRGYDELKAENKDKIPTTYAPLKKYAQELSWMVESLTTKAGFVAPTKYRVGPAVPNKMDVEPVETEAPKASDVGLDDEADSNLTTRKESEKDGNEKRSKGRDNSGTKGGSKRAKSGTSKKRGSKSDADKSAKSSTRGDK